MFSCCCFFVCLFFGMVGINCAKTVPIKASQEHFPMAVLLDVQSNMSTHPFQEKASSKCGALLVVA